MDVKDFIKSERMTKIMSTSIVVNRYTGSTYNDELFDVIKHIRNILCPGFKSSKEIDDLYINFLKYFHRDDTCGMNLNKGLYLYGPYGTGKTLFYKTFHKYMTFINVAIRMVTVDDIILSFSKNGFEGLEEYCLIRETTNKSIYPTSLIIDDVGQGSNNVKHYGSSTNIMVEILQRRYRAYTDGGQLTYISTNLQPTEIKEYYGEYINSRFKEMFNAKLMPGKDMRS